MNEHNSKGMRSHGTSQLSAGSDSTLLLTHTVDSSLVEQFFGGSSVKDSWERAIRKSAIKDFHFHDLRHTFATRLVQNGIDLYRVKEMMGHKSIKTTERYAHHYPESLRTAVVVLDSCYHFATMGQEAKVSAVASGA